ncbi:MAG: anaerobic glycerol-3-phosphate dehydrogenase subunit C [Phycisphaerales bacterium]
METKAVESIASDLARVIRGDVYDDIIHRAAFSADASIYQITPACVVAPRNTSDVVAAVRYAKANSVPVVARGAGSGVAGESLSTGIVFDMTRYMNQLIGIGDYGQTVTCQPGLILDMLNQQIATFKRKIGPDPSTSDRATVGGCLANNATGAHSLQYGYIGDYVESVEAVLANGTVVEFKNNFEPDGQQPGRLNEIAERCLSLLTENESVISAALPESKRNRSGYSIAGICHDGKIDLARMLAGSEGTLCVFTKITLRTVPVPKTVGLVQLEFGTLTKMAKAVPKIVDTGAVACELMDEHLINIAREAFPQYRGVLPDGCAAVLVVEHAAGNKKELKDKIDKTTAAIDKLTKKHTVVLEPAKQKRIAKARKDAVPILNRAKGRKKPIPFIEDVSVDNKQLAKYITGLQQIAQQYKFEMSLYGHAGDGELHVRPYLDLHESVDVQKMLSIANDVFALAWSLGGTISGEHADGLVRAAFIKNQYGQAFYEILKQVKEIFDPDNVMNPGKIISDDPEVMTKNLKAEHEVDPAKLEANLLFDKDELGEELEKCNGCGLCLSKSENLRLCPVYRAVGEELAGSRAKANVLRFWTTGQMADEDFESPQFRKFLDLCVNCRACSVECPSGVDVSKLIGAARAKYVKKKGLSRAELTLSNNRFLSMAGSAFAPASNFLLNLAITKWILEKAIGLDRNRSLPKFANKSFLKAGNRYLQSCELIKDPVDKVAYFVDTYANYNDHELGFAVIDVLRANQIEVVLPKQRPAPLPAVCYGDTKRASKDLAYSAKYLAECVRSGHKIVCSEPSSAMCLKQEMRHFIWNEDAKLVSKNTHELMDYLLDLYKQKKLRAPKDCKPQKFLYHLPCHLFAITYNRATVELLRKLCKAEVTNLDAGCCGIAGTFGMQEKNFELTARIAKNLKEILEKSPIKDVLTECSACKMQIEHISDKNVIHPIKVLAQAYSLTENS